MQKHFHTTFVINLCMHGQKMSISEQASQSQQTYNYLWPMQIHPYYKHTFY